MPDRYRQLILTARIPCLPPASLESSLNLALPNPAINRVVLLIPYLTHSPLYS
jgi:hypothetical protein